MANTHLKAKDARGYDTFIINDFTAGIQSPQFNQNTLPTLTTSLSTLPSFQTVSNAPTSIPADPAFTYGCYANVSGGLYPLFCQSTQAAVPTPHSTPLAGSTIYIPTATDAPGGIIFFCLLYQNASSQWVTDLWEFIPTSTSLTFIDSQVISTASTFGQLYINLTKTYLSLSGVLQPCVIWGGGEVGATAPAFTTKYYPLITGAAGTIDSSTLPKIVFTHQGRIISIAPVNSSATQYVEGVNFTDPPETTSMGTQNELFYPENPNAYGAWGAVSSSELLLIKRLYGGIVVSGDVFSPYVTNVPSIPGTNGYSGPSAITAGGLCYLSKGNGVWIWNGGAEAQKLNTNLQDNFVADQLSTAFNATFTMNYNQFLITQNNWVYDFITQSWWRMAANNSVASNATLFKQTFHAYSQQGAVGFAAFPQAWVAGEGPGIQLFSPYSTSDFDTSWQWRSQPIVLSAGEIVDLEEVNLHMTINNPAPGTFPYPVITVTVTDPELNGASQTETWTPTIYGHQQFRLRAHIQSNAAVVTVTVNSNVTSGLYAGQVMLHQLDLQYKTRWEVAQV